MALGRKRPHDLAVRVAGRRSARLNDAPHRDGWRRETFRLPRAEARLKALEWFDRYPKAAYLTEISHGANSPTTRSNSSCGVCRAPTDGARLVAAAPRPRLVKTPGKTDSCGQACRAALRHADCNSGWWGRRSDHRLSTAARRSPSRDSRTQRLARGGNELGQRRHYRARPRVRLGRAEVDLRRASRAGVRRTGSAPDVCIRVAAIPWICGRLRERWPARARRNAELRFRLAAYSQRVLGEVVAREEIEFDRDTRGILYLYRSARALEAAVARCKRFEMDTRYFETLDWRGILRADPSLIGCVRPVVGAILKRRDEPGDPAEFTRGLGRRIVERGGRIRTGVTVAAVTIEGERVTAVSTNHGLISADAYVLALGSGSAKFARRIGIELPIYPVKGYSLTARIGARAGACLLDGRRTQRRSDHAVQRSPTGDRGGRACRP